MDRTGNMRFKLETMSNRAFWGLIIGFIVLCIICLIVGATGPYRFIFQQAQAFSCPNASENFTPQCTGSNIINGTTWTGSSQMLTARNQQLLFFMTFHNKNANLGISSTVTVQVVVAGSNSLNSSFQNISTSVRSRTINCDPGQLYCDNITLVNLIYLNYNYYTVSISLLNVPSAALQLLGNVDFTFIYYDPRYSAFGLGVRMLFLILTILMAVYFLRSLRPYKWATEWIIEQKWVIMLLLFLLLLNDPFYAAIITINGWFFSYLDILFTMGFFSMILLYFLCIFDSLRTQRQQRTWRFFYAPKITFLAIFFFSNLVGFSYITAQQLYDPVFNTGYDAPSFAGFGYFLIIYIILYIFWILYYLIRLFKEREVIVIPNVGSRYKFIAIFSVCIALITIIGTFISLQLSFNSSIQIVAYYGIFNLYIYFLVIIYVAVRRPNDNSVSDSNARIQGFAKDLNEE